MERKKIALKFEDQGFKYDDVTIVKISTSLKQKDPKKFHIFLEKDISLLNELKGDHIINFV